MDRRLERTYAAVVVDSDGTSAAGRRPATRRLRARMERRPHRPGELLALGRGETPHVKRLPDEAAPRIATILRSRGPAVEALSHPINRCTIDVVPEPAWAGPPTSEIGNLVTPVRARIRCTGFTSLAEVVTHASEVTTQHALADPTRTSSASPLARSNPATSRAALGGFVSAGQRGHPAHVRLAPPHVLRRRAGTCQQDDRAGRSARSEVTGCCTTLGPCRAPGAGARVATDGSGSW